MLLQVTLLKNRMFLEPLTIMGHQLKSKGTLTRESKASGGYPSIRTDDVISVSSRTPDEAESDELGEWGLQSCN